MKTNEKAYLSVQDAAKKFNVNESTLYRWMRKGFVKFVRKGAIAFVEATSVGRVLIAREQLGLKWMDHFNPEENYEVMSITKWAAKNAIEPSKPTSPIASTLRELAIKALDSNQTFGWKLMDVAREAYTLKI